MGFCSGCGAELATDAKFCSQCGTQVAGLEAASSASPAPRAEFFSHPGKYLCPTCGTWRLAKCGNHESYRTPRCNICLTDLSGAEHTNNMFAGTDWSLLDP